MVIVMRKNSLLFLFPLVFLIITIAYVSPVYGETVKSVIIASDDTTADSDFTEQAWGDKAEIRMGWGTSIRNDTKPSAEAIAYLKFNLDDEKNGVPSSDLMNTVTIQSAELKMLIQWITESDADRFIITANYCSNSDWKEKDANWDNRVCGDQDEIPLTGADSVIITREELPAVISWDVTRSVVDAREANSSYITFAMTSLPLFELRNYFNPEQIVEKEYLVQAWSKERGQFGISTSPTLSVEHSTDPSLFQESLYFIAFIIIPIVSTVLTLGIWVYKKSSS